MFVLRNWRRLGATLLAASMVGILGTSAARAEPPAPRAIKIGLVATLFRDIPAPLMLTMMKPLGGLMKSQTGMSGDLMPGGEVYELAQALVDNKMDLGVFSGVEYAWIREKFPQLQPLMIAVNQERHFKVHLMVRAGGPIHTVADLKDAKVALPRGSREHSRLFLGKITGEEPDTICKKAATPATVEDALDDVVDNEVQAAVVENVPLASFARRKPGRAAKLTTLVVSELFPSGVILYNPGHLDEDVLERFRKGMTNANKNMLGRQMLMLWKLTCFEPIPDDYDAILSNIVRSYPAPAYCKKPARVADSPTAAPTVVPFVVNKPLAPPVKAETAPETPEEEKAPAAPDESDAPAAPDNNRR